MAFPSISHSLNKINRDLSLPTKLGNEGGPANNDRHGTPGDFNQIGIRITRCLPDITEPPPLATHRHNNPGNS